MTFREKLVEAVKQDLGWTPEGRERKQVQEKEALEDRQRKAASVAMREFRLGGVTVQPATGLVTRGAESVRLLGARATVESSGQLEKRVTATRLIVTGPFALGLRKAKDRRELYLTIEGEDAVILVELSPSRQKEAREFAARLNTAAKRAAGPT